jgi:hypothetical protein
MSVIYANRHIRVKVYYEEPRVIDPTADGRVAAARVDA